MVDGDRVRVVRIVRGASTNEHGGRQHSKHKKRRGRRWS
jgi:hypothetical protein